MYLKYKNNIRYIKEKIIDAVILIEAKNEDDFFNKKKIIEDITGITIDDYEEDEEESLICKTIF